MQSFIGCVVLVLLAGRVHLSAAQGCCYATNPGHRMAYRCDEIGTDVLCNRMSRFTCAWDSDVCSDYTLCNLSLF